MTCILLFAFTLSTVSAQLIQDSDALQLVAQLEAKYNAYSSLEAEFSLHVDIPEEEPIKQKGTVIQKGDDYFLNTDSQAIYSDGKSVWVHLKDDKEVQINDVDEDEASMLNLSPKGILAMFNKDDFEYAIVKRESHLNQVEFKPIDKDSDILKVRIAVNESKQTLETATVFYKDGIRYTVTVGDVLTNKTYDPSVFMFDKSKYPGIYVEDLRID